jgi:A/G-specific adenine glycosylase
MRSLSPFSYNCFMNHTPAQSLLTWYQQNGRHDLPWRTTDNPFIFISEIMLQQTQVKTVLERFYFPFLEAFPTMEDLACASLDDVLKKWEGLGYYTCSKSSQCGTTMFWNTSHNCTRFDTA